MNNEISIDAAGCSRIVALTAENVKRIKAIEIVPNGDVVEIRGNNGAGKSSVIDAIWMCLGGKNAIPDLPIRVGADDMTAILDLGEIIVTRRITPRGAYLTVRGKDGGAFKSPQALLDSLVGPKTIDPSEFDRASMAARCRILLDVLGIQEQLDVLAEEEKRAYENRLTAGQRMRDEEAAAAKIQVPEGTPSEPISITELARELERRLAIVEKYNNLQEARDRHAKRMAALDERAYDNERRQEQLRALIKQNARELAELAPIVNGAEDELRGLDAETARIDEAIAELNRQREEVSQKRAALFNASGAATAKHKNLQSSILTAESNLEQAVREIVVIKKEWDDVKQLESDAEQALKVIVLPNVDATRSEIARAEKVNEAVALRRERREHERLYAEWQERHASFEEEIESIRGRRTQLLNEANWPISGLSVSGTTIYYNDIPYDQCSSSERLRIAVSIAMALKPKLKVIMMREGSLFDDNSLRELYEFIRERGYQLWIERVGTDGEEHGGMTIVIEDGRIASRSAAKEPGAAPARMLFCNNEGCGETAWSSATIGLYCPRCGKLGIEDQEGE